MASILLHIKVWFSKPSSHSKIKNNRTNNFSHFFQFPHCSTFHVIVIPIKNFNFFLWTISTALFTPSPNIVSLQHVRGHNFIRTVEPQSPRTHTEPTYPHALALTTVYTLNWHTYIEPVGTPKSQCWSPSPTTTLVLTQTHYTSNTQHTFNSSAREPRHAPRDMWSWKKKKKIQTPKPNQKKKEMGTTPRVHTW